MSEADEFGITKDQRIASLEAQLAAVTHQHSRDKTRLEAEIAARCELHDRLAAVTEENEMLINAACRANAECDTANLALAGAVEACAEICDGCADAGERSEQTAETPTGATLYRIGAEHYRNAATSIRSLAPTDFLARAKELHGDAAIGAVVWKFIDRMNDVAPEAGDSAERILSEFVADVMPVIAARRGEQT